MKIKNGSKMLIGLAKVRGKYVRKVKKIMNFSNHGKLVQLFIVFYEVKMRYNFLQLHFYNRLHVKIFSGYFTQSFTQLTPHFELSIVSPSPLMQIMLGLNPRRHMEASIMPSINS